MKTQMPPFWTASARKNATREKDYRFMSISRRSSLIAIAMGAALMLSGCGRDSVLRVKDAVLKLSPVESNPSAMYFTVYGGPADVYLVGVTSRSSVRTEMHETTKDAKTGMVSMAKLNRIKVPADSKIEFAKGGKHVMMWGINRPARRLQRIDVEFVFSNGIRILVETPIEAISTEAADDHSNH
jgi:periplasmic copper chaperone A